MNKDKARTPLSLLSSVIAIIVVTLDGDLYLRINYQRSFVPGFHFCS